MNEKGIRHGEKKINALTGNPSSKHVAHKLRQEENEE